MNNTLNNNKEFLIEILKAGLTDNKSLSNEYEYRLGEIRRDNVKIPTIFVGTGTCGLGAGANKTITAINRFLKDNKIKGEVIEVGCIGICALEPLMDVQLPDKNRISYFNVTEDKVPEILEKIFKGGIKTEYLIGQFHNPNLKKWENAVMINEHPFFSPQKRIVLKNCGIINPESIEDYIANGGYKGLITAINKYKPEEITETIELSGLRGRGGGGFLTGKKWKLTYKTESETKFIICNADEGDPGAFMDRAVIEGDPHRVLEGLAIGAYAIKAKKAYVYIRAEYPIAVKRLRHAISQAKEYGLLGENIFNSGFSLEIIIKMGAGAFVCGEETALINSIEGKRGMPRPRPPYPTDSGLFGKPSVINNVETLSNVPDIIVNGSEWFSSLGTENSKGTKVFALSGKITFTGLVEIPMGTTIKDIIYKIGGGIKDNKKFKAVQIGGPSGGCITEENLDIQIDYQSLIRVGAMMGSGGMVIMDEDTCMVDIAKFFMDFIQRESCGKCIPCREGTRRMLEILESITQKPGTNNFEELERFKGVINLEKLAKVIKQTSLCGLGQSAPNPVLSTIRWFRDEYEAHIFERRCPAGTCTNHRTYRIDVDKCTGCMACIKKCSVSAIIGSKKTPHFIAEGKCISCGACFEACKFEAISYN